eukprot:2399681-Amphidinium_carterae.1
MTDVAQDGLALQWLPRLRKSDDVVCTAIQQDGQALQFVRVDCWALEWAAIACQSDRDSVLAAAADYGTALQWASYT